MPFTSINIYTLKQIRTSRYRYDIGDNSITSPHICYQLLDLLLDLKRDPFEKFGIISLSTKNKILGLHVLGMGSLDNVIIEPRDVFKAAMVNNACAIIAFHNHPSGASEPSNWDKVITGRLRDIGEFLNIQLLDHIIVGEKSYFSLKENGLL